MTYINLILLENIQMSIYIEQIPKSKIIINKFLQKSLAKSNTSKILNN